MESGNGRQKLFHLWVMLQTIVTVNEILTRRDSCAFINFILFYENLYLILVFEINIAIVNQVPVVNTSQKKKKEE